MFDISNIRAVYDIKMASITKFFYRLSQVIGKNLNFLRFRSLGHISFPILKRTCYYYYYYTPQTVLIQNFVYCTYLIQKSWLKYSMCHLLGSLAGFLSSKNPLKILITKIEITDEVAYIFIYVQVAQFYPLICTISQQLSL